MQLWSVVPETEQGIQGVCLLPKRDQGMNAALQLVCVCVYEHVFTEGSLNKGIVVRSLSVTPSIPLCPQVRMAPQHGRLCGPSRIPFWWGYLAWACVLSLLLGALFSSVVLPVPIGLFCLAGRLCYYQALSTRQLGSCRGVSAQGCVFDIHARH